MAASERATSSAPCQQAVVWAVDYQARHLDAMKQLMDDFVKPLRQCADQGMVRAEELCDIFSNVDDVYGASQHTSVKLREAGAKRTTRELVMSVAAALSPKLLEIYTIYADSYPLAEKMMARCRQKNERFGAFLNVQQRNRHTSLDRLLRQPLDCVGAYVDVLRKLVSSYRESAQEIMMSLQGWEQLANALSNALKHRENEEKITDIELSFPNDDLRLLQRDADDMHQLKQLRGRRRHSGAPGLFKFLTQESKPFHQLGAALKGAKKLSTPTSEYEKANYGLDLSDTSVVERRFLREAPMRVVQSGDDIRKRHLFLFNDLLIVAKPKGRGTFSMKTKFKFKHSWLHPHTPGLENASVEDLGFVVGSPHQRDLVFQAKSVKEKRIWLEDMSSELSNCKRKSTMHRTNINIYPFIPEKMPRNDGHPVLVPVQTTNEENSTAVVAKVLQFMKQPDLDPNNYRLWELNRFGVQGLEAWESPSIITSVGLRIDMHNPICQFVLRQLQAAPLSINMLPPNLRMAVGIIQAPPASPRAKAKDESRTSKLRDDIMKRSSGLLRKFTPGRSPKSPAVEISEAALEAIKPTGKLYGLPLHKVIEEDQLPVPIQDMLLRLYKDGPTAPGLFRKSANARMVRQVRERLDSGLPVDFSDIPILAVGAVLKEFLRSLPECLFPLSLYEDFVKSNAMPDGDEKHAYLQETLMELPEAHHVLLSALMPMLVKIMQNEEENSMTARNLGICIGQSMMWPAKAEDVLKNDVPPFIEYLILNCKSVLGAEDNPLYDRLSSRRLGPGSDGSSARLDRRPSTISDGMEEWDSDFDVSTGASPCPSPARPESGSPALGRAAHARGSASAPRPSGGHPQAHHHPVPPPRTKSRGQRPSASEPLANRGVPIPPRTSSRASSDSTAPPPRLSASGARTATKFDLKPPTLALPTDMESLETTII